MISTIITRLSFKVNNFCNILFPGIKWPSNDCYNTLQKPNENSNVRISQLAKPQNTDHIE